MFVMGLPRLSGNFVIFISANFNDKNDNLPSLIPGRGNLGYGKNFLATALGGSSSGDGHLNPTTVSLLPLQSGTLSG